MQKVMKVLEPFFQFLFVFYSNEVHSMLTIMLDPWFKSLQVVKNLVGHGNAIRLASKNDLKPMIPLLMVCFEALNPITKACTSTNHNEEKGNMFRVGASFKESSRALVTKESSLFMKLSIPSSASKDPLIWWHNYEGQFSNVAFLAKQILGISRSQIETKRVFSLVGVLIALR